MVVEKAARLQIREQAGDRLVHRFGVRAMVLFELAMSVPVDASSPPALQRTRDDLNEAHAALDQTAGAQQIGRHNPSHRWSFSP